MKGKVKGTVLFTVLTVMMVMVLFLMSTLILTTSAQRRTYYTFYQKQAQYAAQSALDTISNLLYDRTDKDFPGDGLDVSFHEWVENLPASTNENVEKRTLYIHFNADVSSVMGMGNSGVTAEGNTVSCVFEKLDEKAVFWDDYNHEMAAKAAWKVTATACVGSGSNASEYTICDYIYDNQVANEADPTLNSLKVNVFDGSNLGKGGTPKEEEVNNDGKPSPVTMNAVYTFSAVGMTAANNMCTLGPRSARLNHYPDGRLKYDRQGAEKHENKNDPVAVGNTVYIGNLSSECSDIYVFEHAGEGLAVYGNYKPGQNGNVNFNSLLKVEATAYKDVPYIYVDGCMDIKQNPPKFNEKSGNEQPINLYLGSLKIHGNRSDFKCSDVYLLDPDGESEINTNGTKLEKFVYRNLHKADLDANATLGDLVCNNKTITFGELNQVTYKIEGDFLFTNPNGQIIVKNNATVEVGGDFVCAGQIVLQGNGKIVNSSGALTSTGVQMGYGYPADPNKTAEETYADQLENHQTNYAADGVIIPDFSSLPYYGRLDEIFEQYVRWDLRCSSEKDALDYLNTDKYILESRVAGHAWGAIEYHTDDDGPGETSWFPYTNPHDYDPKKPDKVLENAFIPPLDLSATTDYTAEPYNFPTTEAAFNSVYCPGGVLSKYEVTSPESVKLITHHKGGILLEAPENTISAYVVSKSCVIDLSDLSADTPVFIDPSGYSQSKPMVIKVIGSEDKKFRFFVNNTAIYGSDYMNPAPLVQVNGDKFQQAAYVPKNQVVMWWDSEMVCQELSIITSGLYGQLIVDKKLDVISNPVYPEVGAPATGEDAYLYELVSNVCIFGEKDVTYNFKNGGTFNADIKMPDSTINIPAGAFQYGEKYQGAYYREETNDVKYNSEKYSLYGIGTIMTQVLNGDNKAEYIYLGDTHRPGTNSGGEPTYDYFKMQEGKDQDYTLYNPNKGSFGVDHQGAN